MMQQSKKWFAVCAGLFAVMSLPGCGSDVKPPPDVGPTAPVTGTVEMDGKPLAGATVNFKPKAAKQHYGAHGTTDAAGKYTLKTDIGNGKTTPGAPLGQYDVTVSKFVKEDGSPLPSDANDPNQMLGARDSIPMAYTSAGGHPDMNFEVTATGGTFDIKISSQ